MSHDIIASLISGAFLLAFAGYMEFTYRRSKRDHVRRMKEIENQHDAINARLDVRHRQQMRELHDLIDGRPAASEAKPS